MATELLHHTRLQFAKALRARYREAQGRAACRVASRVLGFLADGTITNANCENAWNMTSAEWVAKKVILQAKTDKWAAIKAAEAAAGTEAGD